jgi:hypothetical protein
MSNPDRLKLNDRERDTIIAALRFWQRGMEQDLIGEEMEIAENGRIGDFAALLQTEIDALIEERINV